MAKPKTKVGIGIPYYGRQEPTWWADLVYQVARFPKMGLEFGGLFTMGVSLTDKNRNAIAEAFLETDTEWIFWLDTDNIAPKGAIRRLLDLDTTMASGLYYGKGKGHWPIAYIKIPETGAYRYLHRVYQWERGEIVPVDAVGFGCMLTHRSVFEDIRKNYTPVQRDDGGIYAIHNDDIRSKIVGGQVNNSDGLVIQGQHRIRVQPVTIETHFPYFVCEYGRTEDNWFCETAARVGHKPLLDTSVECGHIRSHPIEGKDFREAQIYERHKEIQRKSREELIKLAQEREAQDP